MTAPRPFTILLAVCASLLTSAAGAMEAPPLLVDRPVAGDFSLVDAASAADVYVDAGDFDVANIAAGLLAADVGRVTGKTPAIRHDPAALGRRAVIVGTLGHSALLDRLAAAGKIDVSAVRGKWESFVLQTVANPLPNVASALVIAGSDRRGTAFGALELSEQIGVSPWVWWADVAPTRRDTLLLKSGTYTVGPPSVKYRGIFINDEDWGLRPWAAKTFDPKFGNIGPKTYEKVFELLLRLKANYLWPAMHPVSTEFGTIDENSKLADRWGIVIGASHAEPMNRNNVHWAAENRGEWRYDTNKQRIDQFWEEWAKKRGSYEAVWSVGMRGIHDSGMIGPRDIHEQVPILQSAIAGQRALLAKYVNPDVTKVPQAFMPYKEALAQYQAGLKLPPDVTLVWCDDNFGFIRQLSTPAEQRRPGGSGVYYHTSYLGGPKPYLWLDTTPPALIWQQMTTALQHGADRIWVLNVGDIKSNERGMEFWTKLAWNAHRWGPDAQHAFLLEWAARDFNAPLAADIADVMDEYYQLGFQRKPELMETGIFSTVNYGEAQHRLAAYKDLLNRATAISDRLPAEKRDGFYELVLYPVQVAAGTNEAFLAADLSRLSASQGRTVADTYAAESRDARTQIRRETSYFNNELAGGKWRGVMTLTGWGRTDEYANWGPEWFLHWPTGTMFKPSDPPRLGIAVDGRSAPVVAGGEEADAALPTLADAAGRRSVGLHLFRTDGSLVKSATVTADADWVKVAPAESRPGGELLYTVSVDWPAAAKIGPAGGPLPEAHLSVVADGLTRRLAVRAVRVPADGSFVEIDGAVSMEAEHSTASAKGNPANGESAAWTVIPGLGRTGPGAVTVRPSTVPSLATPEAVRAAAPSLSYDVNLTAAGAVTVRAYCLPTHALAADRGLRYAVSFDDQPPTIVSFAESGGRTGDGTAEWLKRTGRNIAEVETKHRLARPGRHTLRLWMVDPGVVVDKLVIDRGGAPPSELGPPETR